MPKKITQAEWDAILQIIAGYDGGASIKDILGQLDGSISLRTLQRRLKGLLKEKRLTVKRRGGMSVYQIIEAEPTPAGLLIDAVVEIPISPEGLDIQRIFPAAAGYAPPPFITTGHFWMPTSLM